MDHRLGARLPRRDRLPPRSTPATRTRSRWSAPRTRARARCRRCSRSASPSATTRRRCCAALAAPTTRSMLIRLRPGTPVDPGAGAGEPPLRRLRRLLEDLHAPGLPDVALRVADQPHPLPVPPVAVHRDRVRQAGVRARGSPAPPTSHYRERRGLSSSRPATSRARSARPSGSLGPSMSSHHHPDQRAARAWPRRRARRSTSWTSATTRPRGCGSSSTRSSRRTGRSCSARSRSTASSSC